VGARFSHLACQEEGNSTLCLPVSYVTGYDIVFTYNRISCPYSAATKYVLVALLSLWEGLQGV